MLRRAEEWRRRMRKIFVGDRKYLEKENSWSAEERKNKEVKAGNYLKKNYQMMMSAENQSTDNQVTM